MTVNELLNTKITLNPTIKSVSIGNTNGESFAISNIQTEPSEDNPFNWNAFIDIVVPKGSTLLS